MINMRTPSHMRYSSSGLLALINFYSFNNSTYTVLLLLYCPPSAKPSEKFIFCILIFKCSKPRDYPLNILNKHSLKELKFLQKIPAKYLGPAKQHSCFGNALVESSSWQVNFMISTLYFSPT